jgi:hypothetical protein
VENWLAGFRSERPSYCELLGVTDRVGDETAPQVAKQSAIGCLAVILVGLTKRPCYRQVGLVAAAALDGDYKGRMVRDYYDTFLRARGFLE